MLQFDPEVFRTVLDCVPYDSIVARDHIVVLLRLVDMLLPGEGNLPRVSLSGKFRAPYATA